MLVCSLCWRCSYPEGGLGLGELSALLGGVLKGETFSSGNSAPASGPNASLKVLAMIEGCLLEILGLPALLIGGGALVPFDAGLFTEGDGLSGSVVVGAAVVAGRKGACRASIPGVGERLGVLAWRNPFN